MNQLTKAQFTVSILACFSLGWGIIQHGLSSFPLLNALGFIVIQLAAIIIMSFVMLSILEWVKVFDLKTHAILTLITIITFRLTFNILMYS